MGEFAAENGDLVGLAYVNGHFWWLSCCIGVVFGLKVYFGFGCVVEDDAGGWV